MATESTTLHRGAVAVEPLADKKGLLFPIAVCVVTIVVSAIWIRETKDNELDV